MKDRWAKTDYPDQIEAFMKNPSQVRELVAKLVDLGVKDESIPYGDEDTVVVFKRT